MIEEALVEALAQEHFNYIAEGGVMGRGVGSSPAWHRQRSLLHRREGGGAWSGLSSFLSPRTAMSMVTIVAAAVAARHFRDFLVEFIRQAFAAASGGEEARGGAGVSVRR